MIKKPFAGKKVVILDSSKCCFSSHEVGSKGVIGKAMFPHPMFFPVIVGGLRQWHCLNCLGPRR